MQRTRGRRWMQIRNLVLSMEPRCVECLERNELSIATQVDHILPLHKGGTDDLGNLRGLCDPCHTAKTRDDMGRKPKLAYGADGWPVTR